MSRKTRNKNNISDLSLKCGKCGSKLIKRDNTYGCPKCNEFHRLKPVGNMVTVCIDGIVFYEEELKQKVPVLRRNHGKMRFGFSQ